MAERAQSERHLVRALTASLSDIPGIEIGRIDAGASIEGHRYDASIDAVVERHPVRFIVESRSTAYPRDIRIATERLHAARSTPDAVPIFAAPRIGATARRMLRAANLNYFDEGGTLFVRAPAGSSYFLHIDRERPPIEQPRRARELFRGQGAQVVHLLLSQFASRREWNIKGLAQLAAVPDSVVHKIFSRLEADGTVDKVGSGPRTLRIVTQPGRILDEWSEHHSLAVYRTRRFAGWAQGHGELERSVCDALASRGVEYALTLGSGAQLVAPFATTVPQIDILVPLAAELEFLSDPPIGLVDVGSDGGENVVLRLTDERWPFMERQRIEGFDVASDVQLYLDLMASPRRGREMAQRVREQRLRWDRGRLWT